MLALRPGALALAAGSVGRAAKIRGLQLIGAGRNAARKPALRPCARRLHRRHGHGPGALRVCQWWHRLGMVGRSTVIVEVYERVQKIGRYFRSVLIVGPTGSGKELVARGDAMTHSLSIPRILPAIWLATPGEKGSFLEQLRAQFPRRRAFHSRRTSRAELCAIQTTVLLCWLS